MGGLGEAIMCLARVSHKHFDAGLQMEALEMLVRNTRRARPNTRRGYFKGRAGSENEVAGQIVRALQNQPVLHGQACEISGLVALLFEEAIRFLEEFVSEGVGD